MNDRLEKICFLPPPADTPWSGLTSEAKRPVITRSDGRTVEIELPLFWYDPPWHELRAEAADVIATAVAEMGVLVSALRRDLSGTDEEPDFHSTEREETEDEDDPAGSNPPDAPLPRIVPYRPERYGFSSRDFDGAKIIDVRMLMPRDPTGRFAYSPEQIERWEATPNDQPLAGGGWVPAATFPPDVESLGQLSSKLNQLRVLSPTAAVFVSMGGYRLQEELPQILANQPDGLILRLDELPLDGLQLASITRFARQLADQAGGGAIPIWLVPGEVTADDAVKLVACGASGVAIDHWCRPIIEEVISDSQPSSAYGTPRVNESLVYELVEESLSFQVERFKGLWDALQMIPEGQRLGSLSATWGKALDIPLLAVTGDLSRSRSAKKS